MEYKKSNSFILILSLFIVFSLPLVSNAQTTGKIAGRVTDAKTGDPLPGAQIMITGKWVDNTEVEMPIMIGAITDKEGDFFIINVSPGSYTILIQMMGYETMRLTNARISVNRTFEINAKLKPTVIEGKEVVVVAKVLDMKKDQTSSVRNISSDDIEKLPVEDVGEVIAMQPGVVVGHFRGGRSSEASYLIDGLQIDEAFGRTGKLVDVDVDVIEEVEVITGTFNAEYGKAMSAIVNVITKDGGNKFEGSASANFGNYYTTHNDVFIGLNNSEFNRNKDYRVNFRGPIIKNRLSYVLNGRYQDNNGHLNGIRRFNVDNYSDFSSHDSTAWYSEHTGNNDYVPMDWNIKYSLFGKLTFKPINPLKLSLMYTFNDDEWQWYDHFYKYNPDGRPTGHRESKMTAFQVNHMLSKTAFYEFKASYVDNYYGSYVYKNPCDERYVHDAYFRSDGPGFLTGGQSKGHTTRTMKDINLKFDFSWQINKHHSVKSGCLYTRHNLNNKSLIIKNKYEGDPNEYDYTIDPITGKRDYSAHYEPIVFGDSSVYSDIYKANPYEFTYYMQDKMEYDEMVITFGVRYDYFNPNTTYPSEWRNPANQLYYPNNPEKMSTLIDAEHKYQLSPRFGISYQLGKSALLRFNYGHFFQMPPLYSLFQNHSRLIPPGNFATTLGNPCVNAERTIKYEVGLWQELMPGMNFEVAVFYKDIYDLLSAKVITTFDQVRYGLYSNKDYGNVRGLELKYDFIYGPISAKINYTLQYTRGNADSPTFTFSRAGSKMDPVNKLIPMSWDQRHTLNASIGYHKKNGGSTLTMYYNSGTTYSWSPLQESPLYRVNLFPNNSYKPYQISVDLNAYYYLFKFGRNEVKLTLLVYNLLDRKNESWVYGSTGRAYTTIVREKDLNTHRSDFNDYMDRIHNPTGYTTPRMVKIGLGIAF